LIELSSVQVAMCERVLGFSVLWLCSGLYSEEVADEEVHSSAGGVWGLADSVASAGDYEEVEILVGFDKGVNDLHGGGGVDVSVELADGEQELALKIMAWVTFDCSS